MNTEFGDPLLEEFIREEISFLREYSVKGNNNPQFLALMNKKIERLTEINNGIYFFKHAEAWLYVEYQIQRIEALDKSIRGHRIEFNVDKSSGLPSLITIPPDFLL